MYVRKFVWTHSADLLSSKIVSIFKSALSFGIWKNLFFFISPLVSSSLPDGTNKHTSLQFISHDICFRIESNRLILGNMSLCCIHFLIWEEFWKMSFPSFGSFLFESLAEITWNNSLSKFVENQCTVNLPVSAFQILLYITMALILWRAMLYFQYFPYFPANILPYWKDIGYKVYLGSSYTDSCIYSFEISRSISKEGGRSILSDMKRYSRCIKQKKRQVEKQCVY